MTDIISPKDLLHKWLIDLVVTFAPDFPSEGVCDGGVSMWTQAVLTSQLDLQHFYQRLDNIVDYFRSTAHSPAVLKQVIDAIYETRAKNKITTDLTVDELKKVEIRALAEAIAIQHEPEMIFSSYRQEMKNLLFPLTASKKNQDQKVVFTHEYLGVLIPTIEELEHYFNTLMPTLALATLGSEPNVVFHLNSADHTVGVYLDPLSKKWHFFDLNLLDENNYHHEVDSYQLAYLIFEAFDDNVNEEELETYSPFSIRAIFSDCCPKLMSHLKTLTKNTLPNGFNTRCTSQTITALTIACQDADLNTTRYLLKKGAKNCINVRNNQGWTPLSFLIKHDQVEIAELLFQYDGAPSIHITTLKGDTPLLIAAKDGKLAMLSLLLLHGANKSINTANDQDNTPLSYASCNGHIEIADKLLQHGANPNSINLQGFNSLYYASQNGHTEIVKILLQYGAQPALKTKDNSTPLWIACQNGHTDIVSLLLKSKNALPCIHLSDDEGITPYMAAKALGHEDIIALLDQAQVVTKLIFSTQLACDKGIRKRKGEDDLKKDDNHKKFKTNHDNEKINKSICPCIIM